MDNQNTSRSANMKVQVVQDENNVDKCARWLDECSFDDSASVCSCVSSSNQDSESLSTTDDGCSLCSGTRCASNEVVRIDDVDKFDLRNAEFETALSTPQNVYHNVTITKSKRIHLGNVTHINGPVFITNTQGPVNYITQSNAEEIGNRKSEAFRALRIVNRTNWLAQPPLQELDKLNGPAKFVIICHSATEEGTTHSDIILLVRLIQQFHIESRNFDDIGYNFLIGCNGNTYIGRGWGIEGAHTLKYNSMSVGICFVGCFMNKPPSDVALQQAKALIQCGVETGHIAPDYKLIAHSQCSSSESPGRVLTEIIESWENFDSSISVLTPSPLISQ